jgi:uncharacterized membrane protein YkoI
MKINRFLALAVIALLVVAAMGAISMKAFAQTTGPAAQSQGCDADAAEGEADGPDLDSVEEERGPQDEADDAEGNEAEGEAEDQAEGADVPITGSALDTASAAALEYTGGGRVTGTEVGDEEGYYEIEVTLDDGRQVDVHLDENFNVLSQVADGD